MERYADGDGIGDSPAVQRQAPAERCAGREREVVAAQRIAGERRSVARRRQDQVPAAAAAGPERVEAEGVSERETQLTRDQLRGDQLRWQLERRLDRRGERGFGDGDLPRHLRTGGGHLREGPRVIRDCAVNDEAVT